jgi:hypothetical protein
MKRLALCFATLTVIASATGATAQAVPDPEGVLVEELIVRAKEPGPAWWRVKDADTTVWILAVGDNQLPAGMTWDDRYLQRRLTGANVLIVGNRIALKGGLRDLPAILKARKALRSKTPLEARLPADLSARYVAQRDRIGPSVRIADAWAPAMAGKILVDGAAGTAPSITDAVQKAAKARKVKWVTPATYDVVPFLRSALGTLTPALNEQCLDWALDDLEAPQAQSVAAAKAWTQGDVQGALRGPRGFDKCMLLLGGGEQLWNQATEDTAGAIAAALKAPGHAVALVSLRSLLAENGIGARLERRGVEVLTPGES